MPVDPLTSESDVEEDVDDDDEDANGKPSPSPSAFSNLSLSRGTNYYIRAHPNFKGSTRGLSNLGNTCFMNSIIQSLASLPDLHHHYTNESAARASTSAGSSSGLNKQFGSLLREMWDDNKASYAVSPRVRI